MLVQQRLALRFATAHVQEPLTWEMSRRFQKLMFNVLSLNVGIHEADMRLSLVGEEEDVQRAKAYLKEVGARVRTLASGSFRGRLPESFRTSRRPHVEGERVERKLWLTVIRDQRREPFLWTLGREFDIGYKITNSATGPNMAIISLVVWGTPEEMARAVSYLRSKGIQVELGEAGLSAPFMPLD